MESMNKCFNLLKMLVKVSVGLRPHLWVCLINTTDIIQVIGTKRAQSCVLASEVCNDGRKVLAMYDSIYCLMLYLHSFYTLKPVLGSQGETCPR